MEIIDISGKPQDLLESLGEEIKYLQHTVERLKIENTKLKSDHYKDDELIKMKAAYDRMQKDLYRGFPISEEENEKIRKFKEDHRQPLGCSGGGYEYVFVPTALGTSGKIIASNGDELEFQEIG